MIEPFLSRIFVRTTFGVALTPLNRPGGSDYGGVKKNKFGNAAKKHRDNPGSINFV